MRCHALENKIKNQLCQIKSKNCGIVYILVPLMPDEVKTFSSSLVLRFENLMMSRAHTPYVKPKNLVSQIVIAIIFF